MSKRNHSDSLVCAAINEDEFDEEKDGESIPPKLMEDTPPEKRAQWGKQIEFMLSCIGYSVGLGNIWRFPYLCMQHGGGAFLVPYIIYLIVCGMSLFFMETAIGQSTGLSTIRIFRMIPFFQGLGWCMVFASGILCIYYNIVIAYSLYYFAMSFNWNLPWSHCNNAWNTIKCFTYESNMSSIGSDELQTSVYQNDSVIIKRSAAEEFWLFNVLEISDGIEDLGGVNWKLMITLMVAWVLCFVCLCRGIRSSGKVVYVTATAPYIFLTVILIRGCTLPGAWDGLSLYIRPDWNRLASIDVWRDAATQIFYSLGPAWGGLITFASYNKYNHNVHRDALMIPVICGLTSIYGGLAIYSVIGHIMYITGQNDTSQFVAQGPGLAFVAYPQALTKLPFPAVWSVLFFLMLITLGLDSQFTTLEAVTTGLIDRFPITCGKHKVWLTAFVCLGQFFLGFILITRAGFYYFELMDAYATAFSVVIIAFIESFVISYLYGANRLLNDVERMIGKFRSPTRTWWIITWCSFVPIFTFAIIITTIIDYATDSVSGKFPQWAIVVGWLIACLSIVQFPIWAVVAVYQHGFNFRKLFYPAKEWEIVVEKRYKDAHSDKVSALLL